MTLVERIRKVFEKTGKSQTAIANDLNVTSAYIWKLLNKDNVNPSENFLKAICQNYNVSYEWLVYGDGEMFKDESIVKEIIRSVAPDNEFAIELLSAMAEMPEEWWDNLKKISTELLNKINKKEGE